HTLTLPDPDPEDLKLDPLVALQQWFDRIEAGLPSHQARRRFLLCLDEFERLEDLINTLGNRAPLNFLRHILQHRRRWILLFSGSHPLDELSPDWSDTLINTRTLKLSYLQKPEARDLIQKPVPDFPDIYQAAAVDRILHLTHGQPYLVQLLCSETVEHLNQNQRRSATIADIDNLIPVAIDRASGYFSEFWRNTLTEPQRNSLAALLTGADPSSQPAPVLRKLIQKDILHPPGHPHAYRLQVPLIDRYLRDTCL
ncbi:MAG: AAA family ATPase, partial [Prochlorothrix sp.]